MNKTNNFPPNYIALQEAFPNLEAHKPLFCYGKTIFNPFEREVTADLEIHEKVHSIQQGATPEIWWYNYIKDIDFRVQQEIEAYGTQYAFVKTVVKDYKLLDWVKGKMAEALSGGLYGNLLSHNEAESKIRNYAKKANLSLVTR